MFSRSLDRRIEQQNKKKNRPRAPEEEETEEELERPRPIPLNLQKSAFDTGADAAAGGINTAPSVFQRQSIFHPEE